MMGLADFLARVFDRTQRVFPQSVHRSVRRWEMLFDALYMGDSVEVLDTNYPAKWAASEEEWTEGVNFKWDAFQWG